MKTNNDMCSIQRHQLTSNNDTKHNDKDLCNYICTMQQQEDKTDIKDKDCLSIELNK